MIRSPISSEFKIYCSQVGHNQVLEYWIEHASTNIEHDDELRESLMLNEVYSRHAQLRQNEVGNLFEMPTRRTFRMVVNGEIVSAKNFCEASKFFIHYFIDIPTGWTSRNLDDDQNGMTQTCTTSGR